MHLLRLSLVVLCFIAANPAQSAQAYSPVPNRFDQMARTTPDGKGAVASVNSIATQAGLDAFARGGNAIDAAAAVAFTLGVVDSPNSGIGGGCFVVVRWPDGSIDALDGREMAPAKAHRDMFLVDGKYDPSLSKLGALAIGVPGSVAALEYLVNKGGKLGWRAPLIAAANIAETGFVVEDYYANRLARSAGKLALFPSSAKVFLDDKGAPFKSGTVLKQQDLAATYRKLAKEGADYFYRGEFAKATAKWMAANGGFITAKDFANYQMKLREPVRSRFHGYDIVGFPPPSSGGTHVAQLLNILGYYPLKEMREADRYHVTIEAMKRVFADRAYWMGDADFVDVPKGLLDPAYAKTLQREIDPKRATKVAGHGEPPNAKTELFNRHTTHFTVADSSGIWVSVTTTLNTGFGSKVVIPGTGVLMNNQMDDFAAQPGVANAFNVVGAEANRVQPRKRPLSSMSPTIVLRNGDPVLAVGAAGGPTIINQVMQVLLYRLGLDMPLPDAMAKARVHHQWTPDAVFVDAFIDAGVRKDLESRGHRLRNWPPFGATQAIEWDGKRFVPVAEPRLKSRM
ncbi:gamma-glutamyltransferase [Teredinibacter turnerae]|uniref:gamma-glutamyltransferase n=1 Tax=Teredinibacter turnerae TaxID=2426 RepID=UPI00048DE3CC|nr:gamma-glutamyltransferase [Teredinibacter turnerae]